MSVIEQCCGTCAHWQPERRNRIGSSMTYKTQDPFCTQIKIRGKFKVKCVEDKPEGWCWMRASDEQLASRVKAGLLEE